MVSQQAESAKSAETLTAVRGLITSPSAPDYEAERAHADVIQHALKGVYPRPHLVGDIALHGGEAHRRAAYAEIARRGPVQEHERVGQPEQHRVQELVGVVD